jgi:hypothetical protein
MGNRVALKRTTVSVRQSFFSRVDAKRCYHQFDGASLFYTATTLKREAFILAFRRINRGDQQRCALIPNA